METTNQATVVGPLGKNNPTTVGHGGKPIVAWSYSALNQFLACSKQYHEVRVLKSVKDPPSEQLLWGDRVHKFMEVAVQQAAGGSDRQPSDVEDSPEFEAYRAVARRFAQTKGKLHTELQLAITNSFKPTGWFAADVWCRGVLDALWLDGSTARVVDWKGGKRKIDSNQLLLFALLVFACYPEITKVISAFVWLQNGKIDVARYQRKDVAKLWQEILPLVRRLEYAHSTSTFIPKPSGLCRLHCPVTSCSFNGRVNAERGVVAT